VLCASYINDIVNHSSKLWINEQLERTKVLCGNKGALVFVKFLRYRQLGADAGDRLRVVVQPGSAAAKSSSKLLGSCELVPEI